jgi:hypothetical protein
MNTTPFSGNARAARAGALLGFVLIASGLRAEEAGYPAIPDAPTVPTAPTLPDAAILREPLQPSVSQEIIEERPSSQHVWISGHWRWQDGRYSWVAGKWDVPPRPNLAWVEPRWDRKGNGYVLGGGYWQDASASGYSNSVPATAQGVPANAAPQPVQVPSQPAPIVVNDPPPPPQTEYIVERPSPYHVWIGGYWGFRGGRRVWMGGHWDLPPRTNVVWVEPRWERRGPGYVFVDGYWQDATPGRVIVGPGPGPQEVVVVREPPPPRREVIPARPPPGMIWVGGYWQWHGDRHIWVSGHFERPPRSHAVWVAPRWERRGGGYIFIEGSWR